jgi:hypothetical protein
MSLAFSITTDSIAGEFTPSYMLSFGDVIARIDNYSNRCPDLRIKYGGIDLSLGHFRTASINSFLKSKEGERKLYLFSFTIEMNIREYSCRLMEGFNNLDNNSIPYIRDPTEYWG